jgi:dimethylaniline monooxygenase (N-oxide forming)
MFCDICIIGSGQSGLTTCKTFIEKGYNVVVLEKNNSSNGLFSSIKEKNYFYWSSSKYMSCFSDFPMSNDIPDWFTIQQYVDYLNSYKTKFGLEKHIMYGSNVTNCEQNENSEWVIQYVNNYETKKLISKKLIVCNGLNQTPKFPEIINNFTGEIIHTESVYRNMNKIDWKNKFNNKKVLLLGGGESAFDIGHIISTNTNKLYYSTKDYIEWFPPGAEFKENIDRFEKIIEKNKKRNTDKENDICRNNLLKLLSYPHYPTDAHLSYIEYSLPEPMSYFWQEYGRSILADTKCGGKCSHSHSKLCDINETPDNLFVKYVVKRTEFMIDMFDNKVNVVYYPDKIIGNTVYTKEEIIQNVDIIVCATGYKKYFPFLKKSIYNDEFIKKIIPKNTSNIAFIGFARPTMGSIAAIAEMQSWWVQMYFENRLSYTIRRPFYRTYDVLNLKNDNINTLVIGCFYLKDLAKDMKIEPNMLYLLFTNFKLFYTIYTGTCHPMIYRIHGEKSYEGSDKVLINSFPDFNKHSNYSKLYIFMFVIYHVVFIIVCIILAYVISYGIYKLSSLKYKNLKIQNMKYIFYIISIYIIFHFYTLGDLHP